MKNKKGFTLVELVIVIAVIAILAGVLIGTFATVITNANKSRAMQEAKNAYTEYLTEIDYTKHSDKASKSYVIVQGDYFFAVKEGQFIAEVFSSAADAITKTGETVTASELKEYDDTTLTATDKYFINTVDNQNFYEYTIVQ